MDNVYLVKIPQRYPQGKHVDVYLDFENEILKQTGWKSVAGSTPLIRRIFEKFFLPGLAHRTYPFHLPWFHHDRILFATLSGTEHVKIFQRYAVQSRLKAIYQFDSWTHDNIVNENAFRSFRINLAFLSIRKAADYFNSLNIPDFKAYWIPEAINSPSYHYFDYASKTIDILQYGRRWEWLHEKISPQCGANRIHYLFPPGNGGSQNRFEDHRELKNSLAKTKIAICVPRTMTHPDTCDLLTVTTRYFECMASKCLILGHAPQDLVTLYGYNPVVEVDGSNPLGQIRSLLDHFTDYIPLIEKNYEVTREKHQWKNRMMEIKDIMTEWCRNSSADRSSDSG